MRAASAAAGSISAFSHRLFSPAVWARCSWASAPEASGLKTPTRPSTLVRDLRAFDSTLRGPSLGAVNYARDFDRVFGHAVDNKEWKRRDRQFSRALEPTGPASMWKRTQRTNVFVNSVRDALRGRGVFSTNVFDDSEQVVCRGG